MYSCDANEDEEELGKIHIHSMKKDDNYIRGASGNRVMEDSFDRADE